MYDHILSSEEEIEFTSHHLAQLSILSRSANEYSDVTLMIQATLLQVHNNCIAARHLAFVSKYILPT